MGDDNQQVISRWLRYGDSLPESLIKSKRAANFIERNSKVDVGQLYFRCLTYFFDVVLDLLVAVTYIRDGKYVWAAVTLSMFASFICFQLLHNYDMAVKHNVSPLRTSVFMLPWNVLYATESPEVIDTMVSIQLDTILDEGLFEAPAQLSFQLFVVMYLWGFHGSPGLIQFASIAISISSLGMANASTFDMPYVFLGKKKSDISKSIIALIPHIASRGFQLVYRVLSLALLLLNFGIWYGSLCLFPMVCIRAYVLKQSHSQATTTRRSKWLLERFPLMRNMPPTSVLIGSMFSDGFFGDAHFRDHLPKNFSSTAAHVATGQVAPQQDQQKQEDGDSSDSSVSATNIVSRQSVRKEALTRVKPNPQEILRPPVAAVQAGGDTTVPTKSQALAKKKEGKKKDDRSVRCAHIKSLIVSESEVCTEIKAVAWGVFLVAVESWISFAVALVNLEGFGVDPFVIGAMALLAGSCMLLRAALHWGLFYSPLKDVPRSTVSVVRGVFAAYVLMAVSIMGVAVETGLAPDDCFGIDCGPASQCIPLTGTYRCDCTEGRSEKLLGATTNKDICTDINECLVGTHTCLEDHQWCINTEGDYECGSCDVGTYASDDGQCTVKLCFSSGKLLPGQHKISSTQGKFTGHLDDGDFFGSAVAVLGDLDKDGVMDLAVGASRDDDGGYNSGAVYVMLMRTDGAVKAHHKISATQGGLVGPISAGDEFGDAVAGLGDLDKDGVVDMVVGAHFSGNEIEPLSGAVYVVFLHSNGTVKADLKISGSRDGVLGSITQHFGRALAGVGDVSGDGVVDLVALKGNILETGGVRLTKDGGAITVMMLEANGGVKGYQVTTLRDTCNKFGYPYEPTYDEWESLGSMGDLNGDGVPDIAVGSPWDSSGGGVSQGVVYLLMLARDGTTKGAHKIGSGGGGLSVTLESNSYFGISVASVGDLNGDGAVDLAVGAAGDGDGGAARGSVYVLLLSSNGTVVQEQKISSTRSGMIGDPLGDSDFFGWGLASSGDWDGDGAPNILVGSLGDDDGGPNRGAVYLLEVPPGFVSPCSGDLTCVDTGPGKFTCAADTNLCLVSDNNGGCEQLCYSHTGGTSCGCKPGFVLDSGGTCTGGGKLTCTTGVLMAGEHKISSDAGGGPVLEDYDWFGFSVAPLGDVDGDGVSDVVVGAPQDSGGGIRQGAAYVLLLHPSGTVKVSQKIGSSSKGGLLTSLVDFDTFGTSVAGVGDMNGDGVPDMAVGAPGDDAGGGANRGAVYVLFLTAGGSVNAVQKISSVEGGLMGPLDDRGEFGSSVATVGDLNGDGVVDLAVGARFDGDGGGLNRGAVYVLLMSVNGTATGEQKISSTQGGLIGPLGDFDAFGSSVAGVGDVDGDGVLDLVVGAPYDDGGDGGGTDRGAVYVLLMEPSGSVKGEQKISSRHGGLVGPLSNGDLFGGAITGLGDLDGDGVMDVAVGASHDDDGGINRGAVYVLLLEASGAVKAEGKISSTQGGFEGPLDDRDQFGSSVGYFGDLNGDGVMDMVVGSAGDDDGAADTGAVYVIKVPPGFVEECTGGGGTSETCGGGGGCAAWEYTTPNASLCEWNNGGCEQQCVEATGGGFLFCDCEAGFVRDKDDSSCIADTLCNPGALVPGGQNMKISSKFGGVESRFRDYGAFGRALAILGDLDGDGVEDLAVLGGQFSTIFILFLHTAGTVKAENKISLSNVLSVAGLGDLNGDGVGDLVAGIPYSDDFVNAGALSVLFLHTNGTVKGEQKITSHQGGLRQELPPGGRFGWSVAVIGDLDKDGVVDLVVGAPRDNNYGQGIRQYDAFGAVWVLRMKTDGTVKQAQKINNAEGGLGITLGIYDQFGTSVGMLGDLDGDGVLDLVVGAIVGNPPDSRRESPPPFVVVLLMNPLGTVKSEQRISSTEGGLVGSGAVLQLETGQFGHAVAGVGDLDGDGVPDLAVGAPEPLDEEGAGSVYVLLLHEAGTVKAGHKISAESGGVLYPLENGDKFGSSLAILGGGGNGEAGGGVHLVVGAEGDDDGGMNWGAVYLMQVPQGYAPLCDIDASRDTCLNTGEGTYTCVVDKFHGPCELSVGGCEQQCYDTASGDSSHWCGCDPGYLLGGNGVSCTDLFCGSLGPLLPDETKIHSQNGGGLGLIPDGGEMGNAVAWIGDVDGDTVPDLAIGAALTDSEKGVVYILMMTTTGTVKTQQTISSPDDTGKYRFGSSVASLGDVDRDGVPDIAVGTELVQGRRGGGAVYVIRLLSTGQVKGQQEISSVQGGLVGPLMDNGNFGSAVAGLGDIDGDGVRDMVVGASGTPQSDQKNVGAVYVLGLKASGEVKWEQSILGVRGRAVLPGDDGGSRFGQSVVAVGDVDGDGMVDIAVGSPDDDGGGISRGAVYVMFLAHDGTVKGEQKISSTEGGLVGPLDNLDRFGISVSAAGDLDGDGVPDIAVGAHHDSDSGFQQGAVYVLLLEWDGNVKKEAKIRGGDLSGSVDNQDGLGKGLSAVRGFDGVEEGLVTLAVGAPGDDDGGVDRGAVYVIKVPVGFMGLCDTDAGETCVNTHDGSFACDTVA